MAYPAYLRERARERRITKKLSLNEIAERLALPKTTVYYWIKDLPLGRERRENGHPGNRAMQKKYRLLRDAAYAQGVAEFVQLIEAPTFRDFVVLYIAEGYKRCRNTASVCNPDPAIVALAFRWLAQLSGQTPTVKVQYHRDQDAALLKTFWGERLGVAPQDIRLQPKTNSGELRTRVWRCAHGVAKAEVYDTCLRARIQAWIDLIHEAWE